ncbi:MAG: 50S ribosomal protein L21 [Spirochaetes bacterium]|nr:50S ribosomal protein L21 [Spirochaetota bacterium]
MYAIVEISGKQYKIEKDQTVYVDKFTEQEGQEITIDKVLMVVDGEKSMVGSPYLSNVKISAKVLGVATGKKVRGIKFKKRKNYTRTLGHKPVFTALKISEFSVM